MSKTITYIYTDNCPFLNRPNSIRIDYAEIRTLGNPSPSYKKGKYLCNEIENCPYPSQDNWGRCPVYLASPSRPD